MILPYRVSLVLHSRRLMVSLLLLVGLLSSLTLWQRARSVSAALPTATPAVSSLPNLQGAAAKEYLQQHGLYSSLGAAMAAARYGVYEVAASQRTTRTGHYYANNPAQQWHARFAPDGLSLQATAQEKKSWQVGLKLESIGYGARQRAVSSGTLSAQGNRIEIIRAVVGGQRSVVSEPDSSLIPHPSSLTEWYINRAEGLEHGFTLQSPPGERRAGETLRLRMGLSGEVQARASAAGDAVTLRGAGIELRYDHLLVKDARGRELKARMSASGRELVLEVEESEAVYPVQIDPVFSQQQKLTASDAEAIDLFGSAVAISGETIVVGARGGDNVGSNSGSAYVFVRAGTTWTQQQKLTASDAAAVDTFGTSVAISGETIVVGAPFDDGASGTDQGSAYVFVRSGSGMNPWMQQQKLTASDAAGDDWFGSAVAISGETIVVGSPLDNNVGSNSGSAYVFVRAGTTWTEQQKLTASDAAAVDNFGDSVAISGETIVVGSPFDDGVSGTDQGSAYVFVRAGTTWTEQQKLTASDAAAVDNFGDSVAISGETIVVGAPLDDGAAGGNQGSAYVYVRSGSGMNPWTQQQKLTASDAAGGDRFGTSVAISGETIVVGSLLDDDTGSDSGSAYVFVRAGTTWTEQQKLTASDAAGDDEFGYSVAISGETIVVGAPQDDDAGSNSGSAYVFACTGDAWVPQAKTVAGDGVAGDRFGDAVAISGETIVVGSPFDDPGVGAQRGAAYVFVRAGTTWTQQQKLTASDAADVDRFGISVAINGETIVVGAPGDDDGGSDSGSAYVFVRAGTTWTQQQKLVASDPVADQLFGLWVAISGETIVVGAPGDTAAAGRDSGAAYVFVRAGTSWTQQRKLTASDAAQDDAFGAAVAVSGETIVVGARFDNAGVGASQGSAYVFVRAGTTWTQQQKLTASDAAAGDRFGQSVGISGETIVVGAYLDTDMGGPGQGSAYVFVRAGATWTQQQKLTASDAAGNDRFGFAVGISGERIVVGAPGDDAGAGSFQGSAYVFVRAGTTWTEQQKLTANDPAAEDEFGSKVGISGETVVGGAFFDDVGSNTNQGSAYIFVLNCRPVITPQTISRQQAAAASNSTVATVVDDLTPAGSLTPALDGAPPTGISVTDLQNTGGMITANVAASCSAATGPNLVSLKATDEHGAFSTASFTVNVTAATAPTANAGSNQAQCQAPIGQTQFTINGSATGGTAQWSYVSGSIAASDVNVLSPTDPMTVVKITGNGNVTLRLTVTGTCSTATSDVTLTVNPLPNCSITGPDKVTAHSIGNSYSAPAGANLAYSWAISGQGTFAGGGTTATGSPVSVTASGPGIYTLTLTVTNTLTGCSSVCNKAVIVEMPLVSLYGDYDGDGKTDLAIWRPSNATFYIFSPATNTSTIKQWGNVGDIPVPGDYDGDGKTDVAVWRPTTATFIISNSSNGTTTTGQWGASTDLPVPGDYDDDGQTDMAVWRPATGTWFVNRSSNGTTLTTQWGNPGDVPVAGDYTGDGQTDLALWRSSNATFYIYDLATGSSTTKQWGAAGDIPAIGDYDGDGKIDIAVWRVTTATFIVFNSSNGTTTTGQWGGANDIPTPGDYDGDGKTDYGVWRPANGMWFVNRSSNGTTLSAQWGTLGDVPVS